MGPKRGRTPSIHAPGRPYAPGGAGAAAAVGPARKALPRPSTAPAPRPRGGPETLTIATQTPAEMARRGSTPGTFASQRCLRPECGLYAAVDGFCGAHAPARSPSHYGAKLMEPGAAPSTSRPATAAAAAARGPTACLAPKCGRPAVCNGYCELHHGSPVDAALVCRAPGCTHYREADGTFCLAHRPGRPMPASPNKAALRRRAEAEAADAEAVVVAPPRARARLFHARLDADDAPAAAVRRSVTFAADGAPRTPTVVIVPPVDDGDGAASFPVLCRTAARATIPVDVRPSHRVAALYDRVGLAVGLEPDALRLVHAGRPLDARRRVGDYDLDRNGVETNRRFGSARRNLGTRLARSKRGLFGSFLETE